MSQWLWNDDILSLRLGSYLKRRLVMMLPQPWAFGGSGFILAKKGCVRYDWGLWTWGFLKSLRAHICCCCFRCIVSPILRHYSITESLIGMLKLFHFWPASGRKSRDILSLKVVDQQSYWNQTLFYFENSQLYCLTWFGTLCCDEKSG